MLLSLFSGLIQMTCFRIKIEDMAVSLLEKCCLLFVMEWKKKSYFGVVWFLHLQCNLKFYVVVI